MPPIPPLDAGRGAAYADVLGGILAGAQQNTCRYAVDGECDEPKTCSTGTDTWDCQGVGPLGLNDCFWAYDGECDEPSLCPSNSDSWDCRTLGEAPGPESCGYSNDGECDEPGVGTGACLAGTDTMDCSGARRNVIRQQFLRMVL